jgi:hypothetical protein
VCQQLELTRGKVTLLDDDDYDWARQWSWHLSHGYARRAWWENGRSVGIYLQVALLQPPEGLVVDHINRDPLDNRRANLRVVTVSDNLKNRRAWGRSQYRGLAWDAAKSRWKVRIGKEYLGHYTDEIEAALVWEQRADQLNWPGPRNFR